MAHVVAKQHGKFLYPLILFIFLFLLSTVLAILFYVRQDEKSTALMAARRKYTEMVKKNRKNQEIIENLVMKIAGQSVSDKVAIARADNALNLPFSKEYANLGLAPAIERLDSALADAKKRIKELEAKIGALNEEIGKKNEEIAKIKQEMLNEVADAQKKLEEAVKKFQADLKRKDEQLKRRDEMNKQAIKKRDERIAALAAELDNKTLEIQKLKLRIAKLEEKWRKARAKAGSISEMIARKADGKIIRVFPDERLCYINLGREDNVMPGLPFSVYSKETGIPSSGEGKAKIEVINVGETTSECRIVEWDRTEPIMPGDLIANIAFDRTRTYKFVVEGEFDLYGTGRPDPLGNEKIRSLIKRFGGKVLDSVSVDTDFVVMGDEPQRPPTPGEDAPPAVWQIYKNKLKEYNHYQQVKEMAISLRIPILNTNRFLAFTGYVPKIRKKYVE